MNAVHWKKGITTCLSESEFQQTKKLCETLNIPKEKIILAFGIHPFEPDVSLVPFLEKLLEEDKIGAVGEAGFDFFTKELRQKEKLQEEVWHAQLELAVKYNKPMVVHVRKGLEKIFLDVKQMQKLPAVLFHSFPGSYQEAESVLKKLPQSYFSFGKQLLNGNKKAISCLECLPLSNLLLETDGPYQYLKNESFTSISDIAKVYEKAFSLRKDLNSEILEENFNSFLS